MPDARIDIQPENIMSRLDGIWARVQAISSGDWYADYAGRTDEARVYAARTGAHITIAVCGPRTDKASWADADFIGAAPDDIYYCLARILRLERALNDAKIKHGVVTEEHSVASDWGYCGADPELDAAMRGPCECGADAHNAAIDAALKVE